MKQTIAQRLVEIFRDNDRPNDYFKLPEYRREIAPHVVGKGKWHSDACMTSAGSTWFWNFADESAAAYVWKGHRILVRGQFLEEFSAYGCPENWKNDFLGLSDNPSSQRHPHGSKFSEQKKSNGGAILTSRCFINPLGK